MDKRNKGGSERRGEGNEKSKEQAQKDCGDLAIGDLEFARVQGLYFDIFWAANLVLLAGKG